MPVADLNNISLYYEIHGSGPPVLLISGLGSDANTWAEFLPAVQKDFQFIAFENRGSGRSSKPEGPYTIEQMAEEALALLDSLDVKRAHVIGKSMGGMIAQVLAARHPGRVRSLVLASTVMKQDAYSEELIQLGRTIAEKAGLFEAYRQAFLLSYSREYCMSNRGRLFEMKALLEKVGSAALLRGYLGQSIACENHDSTRLLPFIQAPSLIIVGKEDVITTPEQSRLMAGAISGSTLRIFPRGGHGFWREFPQDVNPVVRDFLMRSNLQ